MTNKILLGQLNNAIEGTGSPLSVETPLFVGQIYVDTTEGQEVAYVSTGMTSNDWKTISLDDLGSSGSGGSVSWADILSKPNFSTVATSGSYNDLTNKPSIPSAQVNADWNAISGVAQILNKPTIPTIPANIVTDANYVHTDNNYTTLDKDKLAGLSDYTLPQASDTVLGGVKIGANLMIDENGVLSATASGSGVNSDADTVDGKHASDFATAQQGMKADSAVQGVKVNGVQINSDSNKLVSFRVNNSSINESPFFTESSDPYLSERVLIWEDDFTGIELNSNNWQKQTKPANSDTLQAYTTRPENVRVENSNLVITALKGDYLGVNSANVPTVLPWTSASICSNGLQEFLYGRVEAKIKVPKVQGMFPAFWTLGANYGFQGSAVGWASCGEIDIMEHVSTENYTHSTVHYADSVGGVVNGTDTLSSNLDFTQYHIYAIEWTQTQIQYLVDGVVIGTFVLSNADVNGENALKKPHFLLLNMAVGGGWAGNPDVNTTKSELFVDWVRVYAPVGEVGIAEPSLITLNQSTITTIVGQKTMLIPSFTPNNVTERTVKWVSSNPNIAKVSNGGVIGVANGNCIIYAITNNGKSASCNVTVI